MDLSNNYGGHVHCSLNVQASLLRSVLGLALTELDRAGRQTLRRHLDEGMEAGELYNLVASYTHTITLLDHPNSIICKAPLSSHRPSIYQGSAVVVE